ncbi:MAG: pyridoxal phosphate-dependent aminotransferase [Candidatus Omnitrophica bacterium]|nr:pyridoxal phosphate-dependent aminotransferase [Candidatus Omnitrophota bacterium]
MKISAKIKAIKASITLQITANAKRMKAEGKDVVSFGAGEPDYDTPQHIKDAAIKAIAEGFTKYTPAAGMPALKGAICNKLRHDNGLSYEADQVVVSCGAKHSLYNVIQAICETGDEVILPAPYWVSYPEMIGIAGARSVIIETTKEDGFKIDLKSLKKVAGKKTRAIILNSPSNPTGAVYEIDRLKEIGGFCADKGITIISDEIYEKILYDGRTHVSVASLGEDIFANTIVVNGVSKAYSMTGWRIGYAAGPKEVMKAISSLQSHSTSNPTSISQRAALAALGGPQDDVDKMVSEFAARRDLIVGKVDGIEKLSSFVPEGAFYLFCDISGTGLKSLDFSKRLLDEALVAVVPGIAFGADDYVRLSFATSRENITKGLDRIAGWVKKNG